MTREYHAAKTFSRLAVFSRSLLLFLLALLVDWRLLCRIPGRILWAIHDERRCVAERFLPALHFGGERVDPLALLRLVGEVGQLVGIGLEVEELRHVDLWIADQLVARIADGSLDVAVAKEERVANSGRFAFDHGLEALAIEAGRDVGTDQVADSRENVE